MLFGGRECLYSCVLNTTEHTVNNTIVLDIVREQQKSVHFVCWFFLVVHRHSSKIHNTSFILKVSRAECGTCVGGNHDTTDGTVVDLDSVLS